jgi:hypothetical protein
MEAYHMKQEKENKFKKYSLQGLRLIVSIAGFFVLVFVLTLLAKTLTKFAVWTWELI